MISACLAISRKARATGKALIVLFFLWHAGALFVHTLPPRAEGAIPEMLRTSISPLTDPYILFTGQWQNWDLFSPEPMRRMSRYRIMARVQGQWTMLRTLEPATARLWRRSNEFSFPLQLEENGTTEQFERYLRALCAPPGLSEGTPASTEPSRSVALVVEYVVLPESPPRKGWALWRKMTANGWDQWTVAITPCPAPDDPAIIPMFPL